MHKDELFQMQGQIVVLERELEELEISGNNSLIVLYNLLNPDRIDTSILDLEINKARVEFKHLNATWDKAREVKTKIDKLTNKLDQFKSALL